MLKYYRPADAKMALASALVKQYAVARLHGAAWSRARGNITNDGLHKPAYVDPDTGEQPVAFNVSHQAGVVVMVAVAGYRPATAAPSSSSGVKDPDVEVGVDVVCTSEHRDKNIASIRAEGWEKFVSVYADVMAPGEVEFLKRRVPAIVDAAQPGLSPAASADAKLRYFYSFWALREAYVKMTGDALSAEWLNQLEFRNVRPSKPTKAWDVRPKEDDDPAQEGEEEQQQPRDEVIRDIEVWFKGARQRNVNMCLRSLGPDYMIATAVRTLGNEEDGMRWRMEPYEELTLEEILDFAEASS